MRAPKVGFLILKDPPVKLNFWHANYHLVFLIF
jgi:hypothetical protein